MTKLMRNARNLRFSYGYGGDLAGVAAQGNRAAAAGAPYRTRPVPVADCHSAPIRTVREGEDRLLVPALGLVPEAR